MNIQDPPGIRDMECRGYLGDGHDPYEEQFLEDQFQDSSSLEDKEPNT